MGENYTTTGAGLRHPTCNEECPSACSNQWEYAENSRWQVDVSMNVSCGILSIIPYYSILLKKLFILIMEVKLNSRHLNRSS